MKPWLVICALAATATVMACCAVSYAHTAVSFKGQSNIIVWDAEAGVEHFIRNAKFETKGRDLGFIAPTPTKPDLEEVSAAAFSTLVKAIVAYDRALAASRKPRATKSTGAAAGDKGVEIVQVKEVAGFKAVTLKTTDAGALADWLKDNNYTTSPGIEQWTKYYVDQGWFLTAFKVLADKGAAETGLVKMSFKTKEPFNPYYVPPENRNNTGELPEGLRVYFIASGEFEPTVKQDALFTERIAPVGVDFQSTVARNLKLASIPSNPAVTVFEDPTFPSEVTTADIFFKRKGDTPPWPVPYREPQTFVTIAAGLILLGGGILWFVRRRVA